MGEAMGSERREKRKGEGGILFGIRCCSDEDIELMNTETEGIVVGDLKIGEEMWRIIGIYVSKGIEGMMRNVGSWIDKKVKDVRIMIGEDFNARVGKEGGGVEEEMGTGRERKSKDDLMNSEGKKLVRWVEENDWAIFNGYIKGDEKGEFTFTVGRGNTVIDLVIGDEEVRERIESLRIGDRVDSDHHPVEMTVKRLKEKGGIREKNKERKIWRGRWDKEGIEEFQVKLGCVEGKGENKMVEVKIRVKEIVKEVEKNREGEAKEKRRKGWWDSECYEIKKEVREKLREWRKKVGGRWSIK